MTETVLFESESTQSRAGVAAYLRTVADSLQNNDTITLSAGGDTETVDPPASVDFEVKAERETTGAAAPTSSASSSSWNGTTPTTVPTARRPTPDSTSPEPAPAGVTSGAGIRALLRESSQRKRMRSRKPRPRSRPELVPADASALQAKRHLIRSDRPS